MENWENKVTQHQKYVFFVTVLEFSWKIEEKQNQIPFSFRKMTPRKMCVFSSAWLIQGSIFTVE